jgi:hypothetical protein
VDFCFAWKIGVPSFYSKRGVIWPTLEALDEVFQMGLLIDDTECIKKLSEGFYHHSGEILDGCILAMDGLAVWTCAPFNTEVLKNKDFMYQQGSLLILFSWL